MHGDKTLSLAVSNGGGVCTFLVYFLLYQLVNIRRISARQEGVVDTYQANGGHRAYEHRHGKRHDGGHSVGEGSGEQRGQDPHGYLQPLSCGAPRCRSLIRPQAEEEQDEVKVGKDHQGDGLAVDMGAEDGHAAVEGEEGETRHGEPRDAVGPAPAVVVANGLRRLWEICLHAVEQRVSRDK